MNTVIVFITALTAAFFVSQQKAIAKRHSFFLKAPFYIATFLICIFNLSQAQSTSAQDVGWPRQVVKNGSSLIYYQPQIDDWKDYKDLTCEMAFSLTPNGGKQVLGVATLEANTLTDKDAHTVFIRELNVNDVRFPSLEQDSVASMTALFKELVPGKGETISLDRVLADIDRKKNQPQGIDIKNEPPQIFYSASPAIILMVEGDSAVRAPVEKTNLDFVVNTNWDLFYDKKQSNYYLLVNNIWFTSKDYKTGWVQTRTLPKDMSKLPAGENFDAVKKMVPPPATSGAVPKIFFSDKPAEMIVLKGAPVYSKISGTNLLYVTNTDNDLFLDNATKQFYVLLSGRWYRASGFDGPWTFTSNEMPADFAEIPENSSKAHVLASVPGTIQANDAVLLAQVPTTAIVTKLK